MGDEVKKMLQAAGTVLHSNDETLRKETEAADDVVDHLHEAIKLYLTKLNNEELDAQESGRCVEILNFTTNLEHIGAIIDKNLMELASKKNKNHTALPAEGTAELQAFHPPTARHTTPAPHCSAPADTHPPPHPPPPN